MQKLVNSLIGKDNITPEMVNELLLSLESQEQEIQQKDQEIEQLLAVIHLLRQKRFGRSSEAFNPDQLHIFDETQLEDLLKPDEASEDESVPVESAATTASTPKKKPRRRPLPAHYKRIERIIDLSDEEKAAMGNDWVLIGYDSSEQLSVTPLIRNTACANKRPNQYSTKSGSGWINNYLE